MSILVNKESKVLIQGITGTQASFHVKRSMDYGTNVVAGVTPGKGGSVHLDVPVFDTVREAIGETGANASVMYVPAKFVKDAVREAAEAELDLCVCIADGVPIKDMLEIKEMLRGAKTKLIGPQYTGHHYARRSTAGHFSGKHSPSGSYRRRFALINPYL